MEPNRNINMEAIRKLLMTYEYTNICIAMQLLAGLNRAQLITLFKVKQRFSPTLIKNLNYRGNRLVYRLSYGVYIKVGVHLTISNDHSPYYKSSIYYHDLTINQ